MRDCLALPASRARRSGAAGPPVTAGPPDYQPSLARQRPPLARRIARQCLPSDRHRSAAGGQCGSNLRLTELIKSTYGDIFPPKVFLAQSNASRLGSILKR